MYTPQRKIRIVTAASLFDGHDASINIMRRLLQDMGAEVIHLGHNRSVMEVVLAALQEGAQGIAVSSYQGGHMEYFKFMKDLLDEAGANYVRIFGGGGGVIVHDEKLELEAYGIAQIFHPDDGRRLGLEGMIELILRECDFDLAEAAKRHAPKTSSSSSIDLLHRELGITLSEIETRELKVDTTSRSSEAVPVLGVTGTGGAGKSSLVDELVQRFLNFFPDIQIGILCVDPSKKKTGGALLGDRIRMNSLSRKGTFMRSIASRSSGSELARGLPQMIDRLKTKGFDLIIVETSGIGQGNMAITEVSNLSLYVMTAEFGAQSQLEKIDMIDFADFIAINKSDRRGSQDALRDVEKQYRRSRKMFDDPSPVPVFLTRASQFNDAGVNALFFSICKRLDNKNLDKDRSFEEKAKNMLSADSRPIVPPHRQNYLAEIVDVIRQYKAATETKAAQFSILGAYDRLQNEFGDDSFSPRLNEKVKELKSSLSAEDHSLLGEFEKLSEQYKSTELVYEVRGRAIRQPLVRRSLSDVPIRRVAFPHHLTDWGDRFRYLRYENVPGSFPFTAGVFALKREGEDPTRLFAGEGTPERTNRRFHFLSQEEPFKRLSTAFDSVTLYGHDPHLRPDIYGKVGESGVSIATLEDMKRLYSGFDLCSPQTSVSMTINGPAPMILAFFFNTAIDQQIEKKQLELGRALSEDERATVVSHTLTQVRGTVQADILKEDQGQNTCIFSIEFALKMMGDIQEYFTKNRIMNFYSVSISGYHIAEAGANPISQLAFTLSNAFTFVEYYLSRGLKVDDFAPNLSFFFSNGLDPEYSVIGRVARRIWAVAIRDLYEGNDRSQKLKYHIQTSGRSLHAQEIDFNDIRTTLQALLAIYDNCNSLHTNAYDEAITTPTESSVRRAKAIQLIINREFGVAKNENPNQGSYFLEELTELVEEAVLEEFLKINERGGVLGAMERQYQRSKIQEESLYYEKLKHTGELPIIGVNTFIDPETLKEGYTPPKIELARASGEEKKLQLERTEEFRKRNSRQAELALAELKSDALSGRNIFASLMNASRFCTLHQMTEALFEVGGQYRRNM